MKRGFLLEKKARRKKEEGPLGDPRSRDGWNSWSMDRVNDLLGTAPDAWSVPTSQRGISSGSTRRETPKGPVNALGESVTVSQRAAASTAASDPSSTTDRAPVEEVEISKDESSIATTAPISSITEVNTSPSQPTSQSLFLQGRTEFLPNKTVGVPRAALSAWYGQKPRNHQVTKESYITWNDGGMSHNQRFTSIFVCPLTGEPFASGEYGNPELYEIRHHDPVTGRQIRIENEDEEQSTIPDDAVQVVWYKQKTLSEHGAAARAYDCFSFRRTQTTVNCIGRSLPYARDDRPPLPPLSPEVEEKIEKRQEIARSRMEVDDAVEEAMLQEQQQQQDMEDDRQRERDEYRTARVTTQMKDVSIGDEIMTSTSDDDDDE